jgi:Ni,Fe-hydrogenase I small subunit
MDTIQSMKNRQIYLSTYLCEKNSVPPKELLLPFDSIEIYYHDTVRIDRKFTHDSLWHFYAQKYEGRYLLVVDSSFAPQE